MWKHFSAFADKGDGFSYADLRAIATRIILVGEKNADPLSLLMCDRFGKEKVASFRSEMLHILHDCRGKTTPVTRAKVADTMLACFESKDESKDNRTAALTMLADARDPRVVPILYDMLADASGSEKLLALEQLPKLRDSGCCSHVLPLFTNGYKASDTVIAEAALRCLAENASPQAVGPLMTVLRKDYKLPICADKLVATLDVLQPKVGTQILTALVAADVAEAQRLQAIADAAAQAERERLAKEEQERQEQARRAQEERDSAQKACADWMRADPGAQYTAFCHLFEQRVSQEIFKANFKTSFPKLQRTSDDVLNPFLATLTVAYNDDFFYDGQNTGQVYFKFKYNDTKDGWEIAEVKSNDENGHALAAGSVVQGLCSDCCLETGRKYRAVRGGK